jgi:SdpC family antimicrobial peptide
MSRRQIASLLLLLAFSTAAQARSYDGKTLFVGTYFGQGPAGWLLPEITGEPEMTKALVADLPFSREFLARVVADIEQRDPDFFAWFETALYSGDYVLVGEAIGAGKEHLINVLDDTSEADTAGLVAYKYVAVYSALVLWSKVWLPTSLEEPTADSTLNQDLIVRNLTRRLSPMKGEIER